MTGKDVSVLNNKDALTREDVKKQRELKKLEKQKKQAAAKKNAPETKEKVAPVKEKATTPKAKASPSKEKAPVSKAKASVSASSETVSTPKEKPYVPKEKSSTSKEKGVQKVRFDLQPANRSAVHHEIPIRQTEFIHATEFNVHPAFRRLAAKCDSNKLNGVNELLLEFHGTLIEFVEEFAGESEMPYRDAMLKGVQPQLSCLSDNGSHPFPLAMGNLIRQFRKAITNLPEDCSLSRGRKELVEWLQGNREYNFDLAEKAICNFTVSKLKSQAQQRILTYSRCPVVEKVILKAHDDGLDISVAVVDSPVSGQGKVLLEALNEQSIPCTYGQISSIGYLTDQCSIVLLGSSAILSNGRVVAPRGSSLLALCAQAKNIPVLVVAKTCTFVDKVRLDEHLSTALLSEPIETIPEDLVTALVTDLRILPPSSAPAVLKAKRLANVD